MGIPSHVPVQQVLKDQQHRPLRLGVPALRAHQNVNVLAGNILILTVFHLCVQYPTTRRRMEYHVCQSLHQHYTQKIQCIIKHLSSLIPLPTFFLRYDIILVIVIPTTLMISYGKYLKIRKLTLLPMGVATTPFIHFPVCDTLKHDTMCCWPYTKCPTVHITGGKVAVPVREAYCWNTS